LIAHHTPLLTDGYQVVDRRSATVRIVTSEPAYTRLDVDERRRRLLELGADLFTRFAYDELSMAKIAKEAGISKALLYHYWPSKEAYFVATLEEKAAELAARTEPDPSLEPVEQLSSSLMAYLRWIEENASSYDKMIRSAGAVAEVRAMLDRVRGDTAQRIVDGLRGDAPASPALRTAVRGWLGFMDGACLDWIAHDRDLSPEALHGLLLGTLMGAVLAAGEAP
jgi:AcrR family transcriptional regulator